MVNGFGFCAIRAAQHEQPVLCLWHQMATEIQTGAECRSVVPSLWTLRKICGPTDSKRSDRLSQL